MGKVMNNNRKISTERNDKDRIELAAAAAKNSDKLAFVELIGIFYRLLPDPLVCPRASTMTCARWGE